MLAAGAALGLATMAVAPAAMAADDHWSFTGNMKNAGIVRFADDAYSTAALLEIELAGQTLDTYCIQREVITLDGDGKTEVSWTESGITNLDKVAWILHNSVPGGVGLTEFAEDVEAYATVHGLALEGDGISMDEAVQGTQAAIWHFTDGAVIAEKNQVDVKAVHAYLTDTAVNEGMTEAHHSIRVTGPGTEVFLDTDRVGPFAITSDLDGPVQVQSTGGTLVDAQGIAITTAQDGDELWVQVDPTTPGTTVKVTASGTGAMVLGRVFAPIDPNNPTQTLITASTDSVPLSDAASTTWYVQPSIELPPAPELPDQELLPAPEVPQPTIPPTEPLEPEVDEGQEEGDGVDPEEEPEVTGESTEQTTEELAMTGGSLTAAVLGSALLAGGTGLSLVARRNTAA
jgi:TQXA domain-containing protein